MYNKEVMKSNLHSGQEVKKSARKKSTSAVLVASSEAKAVTKKVTRPKASLKTKAVKAAVEIKTAPTTQIKRTRTTTKKLPEKTVAGNVVVTKEEVYLPSTASLRLLEKVELYRLWYQNKFPVEVARFARASGYSFVIVGTLLAAFGYAGNKFFDLQAAATICTEVNCVEVADENLVPTAPLITYLNSLPAELTNETDVTLRSRSEAEPTVFIRSIISGEVTSLSPVERMKDGEFRYLIEPTKLGGGHFEVVATIADSEMSYKFVGPTFFVNGLETVSLSDKMPVLSEDIVVDTASTSATTTASEELEQNTNNDSSNIMTEEPLQISLAGAAKAEFLKIKTGTYAPEEVLIYSKIPESNSDIFLGSATLVQGEWIFSHELYATFVSQGRYYQTAMQRYTPKVTASASLTSDSDINLLVSKITLALETAEVKNDTRFEYLTYIASTTPNFFDSENEKSFASESIISFADAALIDHKEAVNRLLFNHALVSGGNYRYLREYSNYNIKNFYEALIRSEVRDREYGSAATLLASRFESIGNRVAETEQRIADDARSLTTSDTDSDGLADFDELANLKTDPAKADSDLDGVLDGVEVIGGTDPKSPDVTSFPNISSLKINSSDTPVTLTSVRGVTNSTSGKNKTYPVIQGKSLPFSFVYIFIEGTDTTGFIKTAMDGTFQYTFEQELADGSYVVTAALATAKGELIGETKPITFTKTNGGLVATALFGDSPVLSFDQNGSRVPYVVAAAIAVVTFGFILILLAQSLLPRRRDQIKSS
jgi:hypothetical protein